MQQSKFHFLVRSKFSFLRYFSRRAYTLESTFLIMIYAREVRGDDCEDQRSDLIPDRARDDDDDGD